jgi:putative transposase
LNAKLRAVCDGTSRSLFLRWSEGQMSDHKGAANLLPRLAPAKDLLGDMRHATCDMRHDSNRFRQSQVKREIEPRIP